ncbi:MAG: YbaK/EbsC family protein [Nitrososphaerota archaeon]|nr:YbaK/EbsC family protein [Nitrososphaerota archaeon]
MQGPQSDSVQRVRQYISSHSIDAEVRLVAPESTRTSHLAAESLGCTVAEIAKTIGFVRNSGEKDTSPILVTLSGEKRVNLEKLAQYLGVPLPTLRKMNAEEVKSFTGYSIGGVPPFPHDANVKVLADESLFQFERVWAAAGSTNAVMKLSPSVLTNLGISRIAVSD